TYFLGTGNEFTYPIAKSYDLADDVALDAIIYEILDNLMEDHSYKSFNNFSFHDHIDLVKIFNKANKGDYYLFIPENIIRLITSMLQVNPKDRLDVTLLFPQVKLCPGSVKQLEVGATKTNLKLYSDVMLTIINLS